MRRYAACRFPPASPCSQPAAVAARLARHAARRSEPDRDRHGEQPHGRARALRAAINNGMDVAVETSTPRAGSDGRKIKIIHVDAKSDLNLSATATLDVIEKGAADRRPDVRRGLRRPRRTSREREGRSSRSPAPARPASAGRRSGRSRSTPTRARRRRARSTPSTPTDKLGWRRAYFLCDRVLEYTKVVCEAFKTRWKSLGGKIVGEDTFLQSDVSIASQVTRLINGPKPDFVMLASFPGGSPAIKEIRAAVRRADRARRGVFRHVLAQGDAAPVERVGRRGRLQLRRRPACGGQRVLPEVQGEDRQGGVVDSYPLLGYSLVQTIAKGVEIAGTTDGKALAKALETFRTSAARGPDDLHAEVPCPGQALAADHPLRGRQAELDRRLRAAGEGSAVPLLSGAGCRPR